MIYGSMNQRKQFRSKFLMNSSCLTHLVVKVEKRVQLFMMYNIEKSILGVQGLHGVREGSFRCQSLLSIIPDKLLIKSNRRQTQLQNIELFS